MLDLTPWRKKREVPRLKDDIDELFDKFIRNFSSSLPEIFGGEGEIWPSVDVLEDKKNIIVKAEIPGMSPSDFDISISDNILTIKGEKKQEKEEKDKNFYMMERQYGTFTRSITLPVEVNEEKVDASYKDGVLKIVIPKKKEGKESKIKIKVK
ncbi:MAG: Hsp20/alpha crystallin family protein [Deltaproteobacteria bacterium]|nr:MAG: Hsp20/alpha crystallin family protein [Deltaproteobacteria bacterium]